MQISKIRIVIAAVAGAVVLFLWGGLFQAIPGIGISTVAGINAERVTVAGAGELTNQMAYVTTGQAVSFIAARPAEYYNIPRFFAIEFGSVLLIALLLAVLFARMPALRMADRMLITFVFALVCALAVHVPYCNWWGFSLAYTAGVVLRTISGWLLVVYLQNKFIYKTN